MVWRNFTLLFLFFWCPISRAAQVSSEFNPSEVNGWATPPLKVDNLRYFKKSDQLKLTSACFERQQASSCRRWGLALEAMGEMDQARITWQQGCKLDDDSSCFNLGLWHYRLRHPRSAEIPWQQACEDKHAKACYFLGKLAQEEKRFSTMQIYYHTACDLGMGRACANLAQWLRENKGELMLAREMDIYACKEGLADSCPYRQSHHTWSMRTLRDLHTDRRYHD